MPKAWYNRLVDMLTSRGIATDNVRVSRNAHVIMPYHVKLDTAGELKLGKLEIGETSVVISVAAPHRKAAFAACEWLIRELKRTVPIWKKEIYADGEEWIEGEGAQRNKDLA